MKKVLSLSTLILTVCLMAVSAQADNVTKTSSNPNGIVISNTTTPVTDVVTITTSDFTSPFTPQQVVDIEFGVSMFHEAVGDLTVTVEHNGQSAVLFSRVRRDPQNNSGTLADLGLPATETPARYDFDSIAGGSDNFWSAASTATDAGTVAPGTYRASDATNTPVLLADLNTTGGAFKNVDPLGAWTFTYEDDTNLNSGAVFLSEVRLITTAVAVPEPGTVAGIAMLSMFGGVYVRRRRMSKKNAEAKA